MSTIHMFNQGQGSRMRRQAYLTLIEMLFGEIVQEQFIHVEI